MPKALQSAQVLDGLAVVVAYERDPTAFYLRVYLPEQRAYRQRRVPGARTLQEARQRAVEIYGEFMRPGPASGPRACLQSCHGLESRRSWCVVVNSPMRNGH